MPNASASLAPPRGMRDFYPDDMRSQRRLFDAWRAAANRFAFEEYDACVVETLDLLKRKAGEEIVDQIYAFKDKSGRDLALRPEMTPTLARLVAARESALRFPIKWTTIAQCFRYERMTRGRKREHYQWNLDIIGCDTAAAEAEVIATAVDALASLGLTPQHYRIRFSSRALLAALLKSLGIAEEHHAATFLALDKRGKIDDAAIKALLRGEGVDEPTAARVLELLELDSLDAVAASVGEDCPAMVNVRTFLDYAVSYGISDTLAFDLSVIRGLTYYTGIVFEAFDTAGQFRAIFGGGRYDNLLGDVGGSKRSGVGLGFGDVVVMEVLREQGMDKRVGCTDSVCIGFMQNEQQRVAIEIAVGFRRKGVAVDVGLTVEKAKAFFSRAANRESTEAIYIGPDDVERGTIRIKTLATREQREETIAHLTGAIPPTSGRGCRLPRAPRPWAASADRS